MDELKDALKTGWEKVSDVIIKIKNLGDGRYEVRQELLFKADNFKTAKLYYELVKQAAIDTEASYDKLEFTDNSIIIELVCDLNGVGAYLWGQGNGLMNPETALILLDLVKEMKKRKEDNGQVY